VKLLDRFEEFLLKSLPSVDSFHPYFQNATNQMIVAGGKRFRPMLLLSVVNSKEPLLVDSALHIAYAVELLHTYSLIHDDLPTMDNAPLRRGHETIHTTYDEVSAILVGDGLNSESFRVIADAPLSSDVKIECVRLLASDGGLGGMVLGQAIDIYFENHPLDIQKLKFLHIHKTAKLIASSLKMGAIIANYDTDTQDTLYDFGIDLGLLFQMQDDIIDVVADESEAGKTTGNDEGKNSFTNLLGLQEAIRETDILAKKLQGRLADFDKKLQDSLTPLLQKYLFRHNS
jgi:farnesyl diphosphate synthase